MGPTHPGSERDHRILHGAHLLNSSMFPCHARSARPGSRDVRAARQAGSLLPPRRRPRGLPAFEHALPVAFPRASHASSSGGPLVPGCGLVAVFGCARGERDLIRRSRFCRVVGEYSARSNPFRSMPNVAAPTRPRAPAYDLMPARQGLPRLSIARGPVAESSTLLTTYADVEKFF